MANPAADRSLATSASARSPEVVTIHASLEVEAFPLWSARFFEATFSDVFCFFTMRRPFLPPQQRDPRAVLAPGPSPLGMPGTAEVSLLPAICSKDSRRASLNWFRPRARRSQRHAV